MSFTDHLQCAVPSDWASDFSQCLFEWQGLVGGLLALIAAGISVIFLRSQIAQSDRHERERLLRQRNAVRVTLPLTLSDLGESLRRMLTELAAAEREVRKKGYTSTFNAQQPPAEHVADLQAVVASTDDFTVIEPISQIIREIQTLWARVSVFRDTSEQQIRSGLALNIEEWTIQAAQIHALIESLFEYARGESDDGPQSVAWARVESILMQLNIHSQGLKNIVERGLKKSKDFWVTSARTPEK